MLNPGLMYQLPTLRIASLDRFLDGGRAVPDADCRTGAVS